MLTEARKGEIALAHLRMKIRKEGIRLKPDTKRQIANTAKELGISVEEATEFAEFIVREYVDKTFPPK